MSTYVGISSVAGLHTPELHLTEDYEYVAIPSMAGLHFSGICNSPNTTAFGESTSAMDLLQYRSPNTCC